jgi:hypothetical protein
VAAKAGEPKITSQKGTISMGDLSPTQYTITFSLSGTGKNTNSSVKVNNLYQYGYDNGKA